MSMQYNEHGLDMEGEREEESLFGSPPPSPGKGRSPSPVLALPGRQNSAQNVGTIALPGSHHDIELPVPPSALSLSGSSSREPIVSRPPAHDSHRAVHTPTQRPSTPSVVSRKRKRSGTKEKSSTPRPTPPPILLPNPDEPPPANFLRNQQALLGHAGVIAKVRPVDLAVQRGCDASNPIVVEDIPDESLQRQPSATRSNRQRRPKLTVSDKSVDSSLPRPSSDTIVSRLAKQHNLYPVLRSLANYLVPGVYKAPQTAGLSFTSMPRTGSDNRFGKRRKLSAVPAGAADWDVPFPFQHGEGPEAYRDNWQRDRGRQLLMQLVDLIKQATLSAAATTAARRPYYRPEAYRYPLGEPPRAPSASRESTATTDGEGRVDSPVPKSEAESISLEDMAPTPLDQLIASFMPTCNGAQDSGDESSTSAETISDGMLPEFNMDEWLSIINSFPDASAPSPDSTTPSRSATSHSFASTSSTALSPDTDGDVFPDLVIDPSLLELSEQQREQQQSQTPAFPMSPSTAADPSTPTFDALFSDPRVRNEDDGEEAFDAINKRAYKSSSFDTEPPPVDVDVSPITADITPFPPDTNFRFRSYGPEAFQQSPAESGVEGSRHAIVKRRNRPLQRASYDTEASVSPVMDTSVDSLESPAAPVLEPLSPLPPLPTALSMPPGRPRSVSHKHRRKDIIRRAHERRHELLDELECVRDEIWATVTERALVARLMETL